MANNVWITWKDNNSKRYYGKTHSVPRETLADPSGDLHIGTPVTVYWSHGKKKFWKGVIAPGKASKGNQDYHK